MVPSGSSGMIPSALDKDDTYTVLIPLKQKPLIHPASDLSSPAIIHLASQTPCLTPAKPAAKPERLLYEWANKTKHGQNFNVSSRHNQMWHLCRHCCLKTSIWNPNFLGHSAYDEKWIVDKKPSLCNHYFLGWVHSLILTLTSVYFCHLSYRLRRDIYLRDTHSMHTRTTSN